MKKKNPLTNRKLMAILLFCLSFLSFVVFLGRFSVIMVKGQINGEDLHQNVANMYTRSSILQAERGPIYDINGNPIAMDATSYKLVAILTDKWSKDEKNPQHVINKEKTAKMLAQYLPMDEADIFDRLNQDKRDQVEFGSAGNNLTFDTKRKIEEEKLPGIRFEETPTRLYPNGVFASHLIGLAQMPKTEKENKAENEPASGAMLQGVLGIEKSYNELLQGRDGSLKYKKNRFGYALPNEKPEVIPPVNGDEIYLTLDKKIQSYLESIMTKVEEEHQPAAVTATLMDAKTGAIIAASQRPTFDATTKEGIDKTWQNYLSEYAFEPGSTFKVLTLAAAIQEGSFHPSSYYESGKIKVEGGVVHDVNRKGWGTITYLEGLARSSNVAFVRMAEEMGLENWKKYMDGFHIGTSTNSGLVPESKGSNPFKWPLQKINTSFGQGVTATPLQMLQAFSAIANKGRMVKPYFIDRTVDSKTGKENKTKPVYMETPISEQTAAQTLAYLKEPVYSEHGTAKRYQTEGVELAAKTGTAQLVNPQTNKYFTGTTDHIYSVVGYAPADDPQVILYVTVQQPHLTAEVTYGSRVVEKIFNPVMKRAMEVYGKEESAAEASASKELIVPKVTGETPENATEKLAEANFSPIVVGTGDQIVQQLPAADSPLAQEQKVILLTNGASTMPNMQGWSKNDVLKVAEITGIPISVEGEGFVSSQSLSPGSNMHEEPAITVHLKQRKEETGTDTENPE